MSSSAIGRAIGESGVRQASIAFKTYVPAQSISVRGDGDVATGLDVEWALRLYIGEARLETAAVDVRRIRGELEISPENPHDEPRWIDVDYSAETAVPDMGVDAKDFLMSIPSWILETDFKPNLADFHQFGIETIHIDESTNRIYITYS